MKDYFETIVGYEDIKKELRMVSDMLNNPEIYRKLGAKINEGILLRGRPGTGKTTMANCLIKSTDRNVYVCRKKSSDGKFVKNISDTFEEAKSNTPSIILLDDLDKFSDQDKYCDAEEFVTVQSCMDEIKGMDILVIATVNNIRKIPESLMRSGRLGRQIKIRMPKADEIGEIVKHYLSKIEMCDELDEIAIARMLVGESCATLENVINNAAMKAAYNRQSKITMQNMIDTCLDLIFEAPESTNTLSDEIRKKIAYHEAAHAIISELLMPESVSIVSIRENSDGKYGFVRYSRKEEMMDTSAEYVENMIKISLAGKAATELVFGETDMGANNDLHNAFEKARELVDNFCMYGFHNWIEDDNTAFVSENRNRTMSNVIERNYLEVKKLLARNKELLDKFANELIQKTTLTYSDVQQIVKQYVAA